MLRFGILGHPVAHSLSPAMHAASFRALGLDASYTAFDVPPGGLAESIRLRQSEGYTGLNVTVPWKEEAARLMTRLDGFARDIGAINTIRFDADGATVGFNTDAIGFLEDLKATLGLTPAGKTVLLVGCGGAGRALAGACLREGCRRLMLANRTPARAVALAEALAAHAAPGSPRIEAIAPDPESWLAAARSADLVLHCTTAGLRRDDAPPLLPASAFHPGQSLYDIVYTQPETPIMRAARAGGASAANGLGMLLRQGAASFKIWTGLDADLAAMRSALPFSSI